MLFTLLENEMEVRPTQNRKALSPILVTLLENEMEVRPTQFIKAESPIEVAPSGITSSSISSPFLSINVMGGEMDLIEDCILLYISDIILLLQIVNKSLTVTFTLMSLLPNNAPSFPILVTLSQIVREVRRLHPLKAPLPIVVILLPKVTVVKLSHSKKA